MRYGLDCWRKLRGYVTLAKATHFFSSSNVLSNGISDWCKQNGTALVAYSPIGRGALAGKFETADDIPEDDWRRTNPRFQKEQWETNVKLVNDIKDIGKRKGITASQVTLAWVMAQGSHIFPIPGTTNMERLKENTKASEIRLTKEELQEINEIIKNFKVAC